MPRAKDVLVDNDFLRMYYAAQSAAFSGLIRSQDTADDAPKAEPVQPMVAPRPPEAAAPAPCCKPTAVGSADCGRVQVQETRTGSFILSGSVNSDAGLTGTIVTAAPPCCGAGCCKSAVEVTEHKIDPVARVNSPRVIRTRVHLAASLLDEQQFAPPCPSDQGTHAVPTCGGIPQPHVFALGESAQIQLIVLDELASAPCPQPKPATNPLLGTWYRDLGMGVTAVTFTPDEMKLCLTQREGNNTVTITVTTHYTITKDGLVFGAVTGADVDAKLDGKVEAGMELAEMSLMLQELTDRPFSFRTKATSAGLMVSQVKAASGDQIRGQELAALGGLFKFAKDGRVPAPAPMVKASGTGIGLHTEFCSDPPATREPQRMGVDFEFNIKAPVVAPAPRPIYRVEVIEQPILPSFGLGAPSPPVRNASGPPVPIVCNDPTKGLAADAFGQLLQQSGVQMPGGAFVDSLPQPRPIPCYPDRYSTAIAQPVVAPFVPLPTCVTGTTIAKPTHIGTWYRDIGSKRCVVKIEADHLTVTVSEVQDCDGQAVTGNLVFTADYQLGRDGMTAVGLVTSVDAKFDGDVPDDDMKSVMEMVTDLQKALEEKPFAMTFRRYGETLVIGHVRMPEVGDRMEMQPTTYIGGRYKSVGDKPLSPLKAVKPSAPKPALACLPPLPVAPGVFAPPPGVYPPPASATGMNAMPVPYSVYPPPAGATGANAVPAPYSYPLPASATTSDLLPPQAVPCPAPSLPATRPAQPVTVPAPRPEAPPTMPMPQPMTAPAARPECSPTMPMPQPITLGCAPATAPTKLEALGKWYREQTTVRFQLPKLKLETGGSLTLPSGRYLQHYSHDPNTRMQQLLHESEDLRQMNNERRPFRFNDQPSHLTPERIHGGIY